MKLLVITDSHPPHHSGGYELRCKDVLDQLIHRGHEIIIITSRVTDYKDYYKTKEINIYRYFHRSDRSKNLIKRIIRDYKDIKYLSKKILSFQPDIIYLWHTINLTRAMFPYLADSTIPLVYDEGGIGLFDIWNYRGPWYYFIENKSNSIIKNKMRSIIKDVISILTCNLLKTQWKWPNKMRIYFNSELNLKIAQECGMPLQGTRIIRSGVDINQFSFRHREKIQLPVKIIIPGRIEPRKGQRDSTFLIMELIKNKLDAYVTIVGKINTDSYYHEIIESIREFNLGENVKFLPMVNRDDLARLYQESDVCFFTSYATTGFSRIPLEAMACGCLVLTYGNEGSNEIIQHKETGFIIHQRDFIEAVTIIHKLISDSCKYQQIIHKARKVVEEQYSMDVYVDKLECFLNDARR